jgi:hypothetical protein
MNELWGNGIRKEKAVSRTEELWMELVEALDEETRPDEDCDSRVLFRREGGRMNCVLHSNSFYGLAYGLVLAWSQHKEQQFGELLTSAVAEGIMKHLNKAASAVETVDTFVDAIKQAWADLEEPAA